MSDKTSKTVAPTEIRLAVEWLAANANGVSLLDWEPRSQTLLTAADQIEAMASVGVRQEREIALRKEIEKAMEDCIGVTEGQSFEQRAEELMVTEVQHQQCSPVETSGDNDSWRLLHNAVAAWSSSSARLGARRPDYTALNKVLAQYNPFERSAQKASGELLRQLKHQNCPTCRCIDK